MTNSRIHRRNDAVIYAIDIEQFQDTDGDGVGDFDGLINRLGYLDQLGIDCIWLLPFYPSPNRDNGYDVSDYCGVDPRQGDLGTFVDFVTAAEKRSIDVIVDLVVNHTSDQHPWFQQARSNPDSKYRDYYVWRTHPPGADEHPPSVFPGEEHGDHVWTYDAEAGAYYYHRFYSFQPDLDLSNPDVREEIRKIMSFWLKLGVSGFRVDAAGLMTQEKRPGLPPPADRHEFLRTLKAYATQHGDDVYLLAEADDDPAELASYFGDGDEMDLLLNFVLDAYLMLALATERGQPIEECLGLLPAPPETGAWANFLRNYDELNIGRLPSAAQQLVFDRFAPDNEMRIYGRGIRRRLAPMLDGKQRWLELAWSLLFSMPGATVLVYGDEIGMGDDLSLPGRAAVRTPMQWSSDDNAGFSTAPDTDLVRPIISSGPFSYERVNVYDQRECEGSLLSTIQELIDIRHELPAFRWDDLVVLETETPSAFAHRYDETESSIGLAHNLTDEPCSITLDLGTGGPVHPLLGRGSTQEQGEGQWTLDLPEYGYLWLRADR